MPATVEFWFDFISPFGYLAWQRIHPLADAFLRGQDPIDPELLARWSTLPVGASRRGS